MTEEKWMYTSRARSTMTRLESLARPSRSIEFRTEHPRNSTVAAGWICCAAGLLCAWMLPPAHLFFAVAFILAIVAMSTHQVKQGMILLGATVVGSVLCGLAWFGLVAMLARPSPQVIIARINQVSVLDTISAALGTTEHLARSGASSAIFPTSQDPTATPALAIASDPLSTDDIAMMLRVGYDDDEVIATTRTRQLTESISGARANILRSLGAGDKLIVNLRARPLYAAPLHPAKKTTSFSTAMSNPYPASALSAPVSTTTGAARSGTTYQENDQRIEQLKTQIEALDNDIRHIQTNPQDYGYWWHYYGKGNGNVDLEKRDAYLKQLDLQRNNLRREKWRLEGR